MKVYYGDIISAFENGDIDILVHGCNCFNTMGAGIAKVIKDKYPAAYAADCVTTKGDFSKLGQWTSAPIKRADGSLCMIINAYTQYEYGAKESRGDHIRMDAIEKVLKEIKESKSPGTRIGFPAIGCGLAGQDWLEVNKLICQIFENSDDISIYLY